MILSKYQDFIGIYRVDENVQQAKLYLKKRALASKKAKTKKEDEKLTPDEERRAENDPAFLKVKELLRDNPGYVFPFTKFLLDEEVPYDELVAMYNKIKEYKQFLATLPMAIDKYADVIPDSSDERKGFERLGDDLTKIGQSRITKKFVDRLPGDFVVNNLGAKDKGTHVDSIKRAYQNSPAAIKEKVAGIAQAFDEFGKGSDGSVDAKKNKELQDYFFSKIRRYRNLNEVIQAALSYIKSASNASVSKFYQKIHEVSQKYGELNGAEIVYDENNILILEIKSFQANKELNSNTSHCIASSSYQWDSYVGADTNFSKQYYIYNFNLTPGDNKSIIGITIAADNRNPIRACHLKNDAGFSSDIRNYMRSINVPFDVLAPMTPQEVEIKKKRVIANKEIVKANLSLENAKKYIEEGADPNAQQGKPLINAVSENNLEKTKFLLEMGASPNIGQAIKEAQNLEMIKTLVSAGATLTNHIFEKVANDYDAVKYLIDAGMDVDFEQGLPLRTAAKHNRKDIMELLLNNGAQISTRRFMVIKWAAEFGNVDILMYLLDRLERTKEPLEEKSLKDWIHWAATSDKIDEKQGKIIIGIIEDLIKKKPWVKK